MQFTVVALLALASAAFASPAELTYTTQTTKVITITSCGAEVTLCPARVSTTYVPVVVTYPAGAAYPSGAMCNGSPCVAGTGGVAYGSGSGTGAYHAPTLTGYSGPQYTGAAGQVKVAGALAGVGAVAALLL